MNVVQCFPLMIKLDGLHCLRCLGVGVGAGRGLTSHHQHKKWLLCNKDWEQIKNNVQLESSDAYEPFQRAVALGNSYNIVFLCGRNCIPASCTDTVVWKSGPDLTWRYMTCSGSPNESGGGPLVVTLRQR